MLSRINKKKRYSTSVDNDRFFVHICRIGMLLRWIVARSASYLVPTGNLWELET